MNRWAGPLLSWDQIGTETSFAFLTGLSVNTPPPHFRLWESPSVCQRTSPPWMQQCSSHNTIQRWGRGGFLCRVRSWAPADYGGVSSSSHKEGVLAFACIWVFVSRFSPCLFAVSFVSLPVGLRLGRADPLMAPASNFTHLQLISDSQLTHLHKVTCGNTLVPFGFWPASSFLLCHSSPLLPALASLMFHQSSPAPAISRLASPPHLPYSVKTFTLALWTWLSTFT